MFTILGWIITGWVAGSIAEWFLPHKTPTPGWQTIATGVAGSIVGGMVYAILHGRDYSPAGLVWSCGGAVLCLVAYRWYTEGAAP